MSAVDDVNTALEEAGRRRIGRPNGSMDEPSIREAERLLEVRLPPSYRAFLERAASGTFGWYEINGLVADLDAPGPPNVIWETSRAREEYALPRQFVVLTSLDDSSALALDTDAAEGPVVKLWPGETDADLVQGEVAPSFGQFLLRTVREF